MSKLYGIEYAPSSVKQMLASLDLDRAMLSKPVRQLSKGMAQKLGLAATLLSRKDLFVLDEPMNGLDPKTRARFKHYLLGLKAQGHTLFFSTHLFVDVEALCDHIVILHEGELRFVGSPRDCSAQFGNGESLEQAYLKLVTRDDELKDLA